MRNTLLFELCNAVKQAQDGGYPDKDTKQDLDVFLHGLVEYHKLEVADIEKLLAHAKEVAR